MINLIHQLLSLIILQNNALISLAVVIFYFDLIESAVHGGVGKKPHPA